MEVLRIDHIQLAMPAGREDEACRFYGDLLGIPEKEKPPPLAERGSVWFERGDLKIHLGVDKQFVAARKGHPAFVVANLSALIKRLRTAGVTVRDSEPLDGYLRVYADDPFGNRLELLERTP